MRDVVDFESPFWLLGRVQRNAVIKREAESEGERHT